MLESECERKNIHPLPHLLTPEFSPSHFSCPKKRKKAENERTSLLNNKSYKQLSVEVKKKESVILMVGHPSAQHSSCLISSHLHVLSI